MKVLGICGSLRRDSFNRKVLLNAKELLPSDVEFDLWSGLKAVPPYDGDDDLDPGPPAVEAMRETIRGVDAVLISTPEYNSSVSGVLKNALDWASRPLAENVLRNKPVAVVGASPGRFGALLSQRETRKVLKTIGAHVVGEDLPIARANTQFDENGRLVDDEITEALGKVVETLLKEVRAGVPAA